MKLKLTGNVVANWVEKTVDEIKELLQQEEIPFNDSWTSDDTALTNGRFYKHQILFPWDEGDVVVGTLHCWDDDIIAGRVNLEYPSIETYHFPFDEGDITVFGSPREFVRKLKDYYISKGEKENAKTVSETAQLDEEGTAGETKD